MSTSFSHLAGPRARVPSFAHIESGQQRLRRWPLELLADRVANARDLFTARAASTRFPVRAIRYWWAHCALLDEIHMQGRPLVIGDVGCSTGLLRRYTGHVDGADWMGLDWKIEAETLRDRGYSSCHECDFDRPLPLADASVDVAVHLHVIEHLPRPEFAFAEVARIVKPGGVILAGSPVMPPLLSALRERQHRRKLARGRIAIGRHINSMDGPRWIRLARGSGLVPEMVQGAFSCGGQAGRWRTTRGGCASISLGARCFPRSAAKSIRRCASRADLAHAVVAPGRTPSPRRSPRPCASSAPIAAAGRRRSPRRSRRHAA